MVERGKLKNNRGKIFMIILVSMMLVSTVSAGTEVFLQTADVDNLADTYISQYSSGNDNYGTSLSMKTTFSTSAMMYPMIMWNITQIPNLSPIEDATLKLWITVNPLTGAEYQNISTHRIYQNYSWAEETVVWNDGPGAGYWDPYYSDTEYKADADGTGFYDWEVSPLVSRSTGDDNFSMMLRFVGGSAGMGVSEDIEWVTKEYTFNTDRRPNLNITYLPTEGSVNYVGDPRVLQDIYMIEDSANPGNAGLRTLFGETKSNWIIMDYHIPSFPEGVTVDQANITLTCLNNGLDSDAEGYDIEVHHVYDSYTWEETVVTWATGPASGTDYNAISMDSNTFIGGEGEPCGAQVWDVTDAINAQKNKNKVTLLFTTSNKVGAPADTDYIYWLDGEDSYGEDAEDDDLPRLQISYSEGGGEPEADITAPTFDTIPANTSILYGNGFGVLFEASDETAFDTFAINWTTNFEINSTGWLQNSTANLPVGTYLINVTINDTSNNIASTIYSVEINQSVPEGSLSNTDTWTEPYLEEVTIGLTETNAGDGDLTYIVYRDGVSKATGETVTLGVGTYDYVLNTTGGTNYTANASMDAQTLTIEKIIPEGSLAGATPIDYLIAGDVTGSETNTGDGDVTYQLFRDDVLVSNPDTEVLGAGTYNYIYNTTGGANYSANASMDTFELVVDKVIAEGSISGTASIPYGTAGDVTGSESNAGDDDVDYKLYRDDVEVSNPDTDVLPVGSYDYIYNSTEGANWTTNASLDTFTLEVTIGTPTINLTLNDIQGNVTIAPATTIDLNCSTIAGDPGAYLVMYREGVLINNGTTPIGNTTTFSSVAVENITCIYEATANYSTISQTYFVNVSDTQAPVITFIDQTPANLTVLDFGDVTINYNITDVTGVDNATVKLHYKTNDTTNDYYVLVNGSILGGGYFAGGNYEVSNLSLNWTFVLEDNFYFPATYNLGEVTMESTAHNIYTLDNLNEYIKIELLNVSSAKNYSIFEVMANTSDLRSLSFFYCNSSYTTGVPIGNANCVDFNTLAPTSTFNHTHTVNSAHQLISVPIDTSTGKLGDIVVTPTSYFLMRGNLNPTNSWDAYYVSDVGRAGSNQYSTDKAGSWTDIAGTFDAHLHQYDGSETFYYFLEACDLNGICDNSTVQSDLLELGGLPPSAPEISNPTAGNYSGDITINYSSAVSPNAYAISFYNITLVDLNETLIATIQSNNSLNLSFVFDSTSVAEGVYLIRVQAEDENGLTSFGLSEDVLIDNTNPALNITTPANGTISSNFGLPINYTYSDDLSGIDSCWWYDVDGGVNTTFTCGDTVLGPWISGLNEVTVYVNDTAGNENSSYVAFEIDALIPENAYDPSTSSGNLSQNYIFVNVTTAGASTITFFLYNSTDDLINTTAYPDVTENITWYGLDDGVYSFNVTAFDLALNTNTTELRTVNLDTTLPVVSINAPTEGQSFGNFISSINILGNFSTSDTNLDTCWYAVSGSQTTANTTLATCTGASNTVVLSVTSSGASVFTLYTNDSAGNENSASVNFSVADYDGASQSGGGSTSTSDVSTSDSINAGYNRSFLCDQSEYFINVYSTSNVLSYTDSNYNDFKNKLVLIMGFGISDEILKSFIDDFANNCPDYIEEADDPITIGGDDSNQKEFNYWIIVYGVGIALAIFLVIFLLDRKNTIMTAKLIALGKSKS